MASTWSQDLFVKAYEFAEKAHRGQKISGTDFPYIMHVTLVSMEIIAALQVEKIGDADLAVQCALLHDLIEDTLVTHRIIEQQFGKPVADGVLALSKDRRLPKEQQMKDSLQRILKQPREVQMVKLADRITNLRPPPSYWSKEKIMAYRDESTGILQMLGAASEFLSARLHEKVQNYREYY